MIQLRAHHLLCMSRFHNEGWYSKDFEKNFKSILNKIMANREVKIKILRDCDDVCKKCPHKGKDVCAKPSKYKISHWVRVMDNKVMRLIKIKPNSNHNAGEVLSKAGEISNKNLKNICKGCEYLANCLKIGVNKQIKERLL
jgi:hypothetical protein